MNDDILIRLSKQMHEAGKSIQNQGNKYPATTGMYLLLHVELLIFLQDLDSRAHYHFICCFYYVPELLEGKIKNDYSRINSILRL